MKTILKISVLSLIVLGGSLANAESVNIYIEGKVIAAPCTVNNNNSNLNVNLGNTIQASGLTDPNSGSELVPFNISLTACPSGTSNVKVMFTGTADEITPTMYKNTGNATNIAVEISEQGTGTLLSNNSSLIQPVLADKTVTFALNARAYSALGSVMPGNISSVVQATFTYN